MSYQEWEGRTVRFSGRLWRVHRSEFSSQSGHWLILAAKDGSGDVENAQTTEVERLPVTDDYDHDEMLQEAEDRREAMGWGR